MSKPTYYFLVTGLVAMLVWVLLFYNRAVVRTLARVRRRRSAVELPAGGWDQFHRGFVGFYEAIHRPALVVGVVALTLAGLSAALTWLG